MVFLMESQFILTCKTTPGMLEKTLQDPLLISVQLVLYRVKHSNIIQYNVKSNLQENLRPAKIPLYKSLHI